MVVGQVLSLKIRFNNNGDISRKKHPYLIMGIWLVDKKGYNNKKSGVYNGR